MLTSLVTKAKQTKIPIWKWVLGFLIGTMVLLGAWWLHRRLNELRKLRAEKRLVEERQKDMAMMAANEKDADMAVALREEAQALEDQSKWLTEELTAREREYAETKKRINDAENWQELEKEARGDK